MSPSEPQNHVAFYSKAYIYDLAFRFKDIEAENQTLVELYEGLHGHKPRSFLDIAAGPATNAIQMYQRYSIEPFALDYSPEMVAYGLSQAAAQGVPLQYLQGDMRKFELQSKVDIAAIFMASTGYLLSNDDMVSHLQAVAANLSAGGLYVLEMTHPRDIFGLGSSTSQSWEEAHEGCSVRVDWGAPEDVFDPIQEIRHITAKLSYKTPTESGEILDRCPQREFTYQEMRCLVELSGAFEWVTTIGSWKACAPFSNEAQAWRMMPVLRKRG